MRLLTVGYLLFVAGAFTGFLTPCRTALATRRAARSARSAVSASALLIGDGQRRQRARRIRS